jgi:hypothetical protein
MEPSLRAGESGPATRIPDIDRVTAMHRDASNPRWNYLFNQNLSPRLQQQRDQFWIYDPVGTYWGAVVEPSWANEKVHTHQGGQTGYLHDSMTGIQSGTTGGNLYYSKREEHLEGEAAAEWAVVNRSNNQPTSPSTPPRRNWEPTHHAGQGREGSKFDWQAAEQADRRAEEANKPRQEKGETTGACCYHC